MRSRFWVFLFCSFICLGTILSCHGKSKKNAKEKENFVYLSFGSGETGGDYCELKITMDSVAVFNYVNPLTQSNNESKKLPLSEEQIKSLFSDLKKAGILRLKSTPSTCCDHSWTKIEHNISGKNVTLTLQHFKKVPRRWNRVIEQFLPILKNYVPENPVLKSFCTGIWNCK